MRIFQRLLASAALLALVGCGGDDIRLATTGRVVKGGAPFTVPADDFVRVTFFPMAADGGSPTTSYAGEYNNADGTFKAVGPDLRGIPPGKYRVGIAHERKRKDLLKGAYDIEKSPFVFDIDAKTAEIVIDLDNPPKG